MSQEASIALDASRYEHLTPQFKERFQVLLHELDPLGSWQASYADLVVHCLTAIDQFLGRLRGYLDQEHQSLVTDALFASFEAHELTLRKSEDALFFEHPLATADYLAGFRLDAPTLAAALLHDVAEDTKVSVSRVVELFGPEVGKLVDGVTKLRVTGRQVASQLQQDRIRIESINKLFQFMVDDVRVVLVKLSDRRHNMTTLDALPQEKRREKAREVVDVYAPLAYRLGMWDVKSELEEMALQTLHPEFYDRLEALMERRAREQDTRLEMAQQALGACLSGAGLEALTEPSPEQIYTVYRELAWEGRLRPKLSETIRIAVLVDERPQCYRVLCAVHELWKPVPGTFDDYIAHPRENLYQSLHTTVIGPGGLLKVRIRTHEMHQIAHHGILTRWSANIPHESEALDAQVQRLLERLKPVSGIAERDDRLAAYREALTGQIQVFTPDGDLIELPAGSTPLDYGYQIHTGLGDEARGCRINGVPMPLSTPLRSGDEVTIIRVKEELPLREWLDEDLGFVRTTYARNKIRRAFRRIKGVEAVSAGREALHREMHMMGVEDYDLEAVARDLEYDDAESLLVAIARAELMPYAVAHRSMAAEWDALETQTVDDTALSEDGTILVRGVPDLQTRLCRSCEPAPGDPIVGNMLRGGQVTVHRMDCPHISSASRQGSQLHLLEVEWVERPRTVRPVHVCVAAVDRSGLAHDITQILRAEDMNIRELYGVGNSDHHIALLGVTFEATDLRQVSRILHRIAQVPNLAAVQRVPEFPESREETMKWAIESVQGN
jgi:GTP pyrophosphokinase